MADKVDVNPTPIQRNAFDVAMELTNLYMQNSRNANIEEVDKVFARFYATAKLLQHSNGDTLRKQISTDMKL